MTNQSSMANLFSQAKAMANPLLASHLDATKHYDEVLESEAADKLIELTVSKYPSRGIVMSWDQSAYDRKFELGLIETARSLKVSIRFGSYWRATIIEHLARFELSRRETMRMRRRRGRPSGSGRDQEDFVSRLVKYKELKGLKTDTEAARIAIAEQMFGGRTPSDLEADGETADAFADEVQKAKVLISKRRKKAGQSLRKLAPRPVSKNSR